MPATGAGANYNAALAVRVMETGCRCWAPLLGAGCVRGGDRVPVPGNDTYGLCCLLFAV